MRPVDGVELSHDLPDVNLYRTLLHIEFIRNEFIRLAFSQELEHL